MKQKQHPLLNTLSAWLCFTCAPWFSGCSLVLTSPSHTAPPHLPMSALNILSPGRGSTPPPVLPPPTLITKKRRWTLKHQLSQRYATESNADDAFFTHSKHVLVCSWSGRPIYTRYGDDSKLAAYTGVITALIENYRRIHNQHSLRYIRAGVYSIVFRLAGPIYLIAISRTGESVASLLSQLDYVHAQIVSILTGQVSTILQQRPQYDVRNLMTGTELLLSDLITDHDRNLCFLLGALHFVPLPKPTRSKLQTAMKRAGKAHVYAFLLSATHLLALHNNTKQAISCRDVLLLTNFLHNSQSLNTSESFTPFCLPDFNSTGYLYAYTSYITDHLALCLLSTDSGSIQQLKEAKSRVMDVISRGRGLEELLATTADEAVNGGGAAAVTAVVSSAEQRDPYIDIHEIEGLNVGELLHFVYVQGTIGGGQYVWGGGSSGAVGGGGVQGGQLLQSHYAVPFHDTAGKRRLFRCYQSVLERGRLVGGKRGGGDGGGMQVVWDVNNTISVLLLNSKDGLLLCALLSTVEKAVAMQTAQRILRWIKKEEQNLFY